MSNVISIADQIFDNPTFNDLNPTGLIPQGGRLMSSAPHTDGMYICNLQGMNRDSANLLTTRTGPGDWALTRTAAGAETYNVSVPLDILFRTGEKYFFDQFNQDNKVAAPAKGIEVVDFFVISKCGVVTLTSATLRLGKLVYGTAIASPGAAPAQTDLVAATAVVTATSANYVLQKVAGPTPLVFSIDDLGSVEIEYHFVMANTGTVAVAAIGMHCNFNYN